MQSQNTVTKTENKVLFALGEVYLTIGAREALKESNTRRVLEIKTLRL